MKIRLLLCLSILALSLPSFAGDLCASPGSVTTADTSYDGPTRVAGMICLCNAAADCDAGTAGNQPSKVYSMDELYAIMPSFQNASGPAQYIFERNLATGCSGDLTAAFMTGPDTDTPHTLGPDSSVNNGTSRIVLNADDFILDKYLKVTLSNTISCSQSEILLGFGFVAK